MRRTGGPGQVTQRTSYDEAGEPYGLTYSGTVQPVRIRTWPPPCPTTGRTHGYDTADRPTTVAATNQGPTGDRYVYDELGRQTTLPAVDTPGEAKGDM
ncbi:MAG: hypothetical protein HHJ11_09820 [Phycicoccus sp.]|nr:hypothetical protein [Phycicoccus sp.]NMM33377.1 hypothetical protein [Phycicoccus sp.]